MPKKKGKTHVRYQAEDFLRTLGAHCRRLRTQKGLSIDRVARQSEGLSTSVVQRLETGSGSATLSSLVRYAEVLEIHPRDLLDFPFEHHQSRLGRIQIVPASDPAAQSGRFRSHLPYYSLKAAAGAFGQGQDVEVQGWVDARRHAPLDPSLFVVQAVGDSMLPAIRDGDYLVMRSNPSGSRQGKIVLAQYRGPADPETGGSYTVKRYRSSKLISADGDEGAWRHQQITLEPLNPQYEPLVLTPKDEGDFRVVAEFVSVLKAPES